MKLINLTGKRYGTLTVVEQRENIGKDTGWFCVCDCGNTGIFRGSTLRNGMTRSCGCMKRKRISEAQREDLTGKIFGFLLVEEIDSVANNRQCKWKCKCLLCGGSTIVYASNLKRHHTISCGCLATSENEVLIDKYLRSKNINYSHGYQFKDLTGPGGGYLEFDFALKDNNNNLLALIEYQGIQHYREILKAEYFGKLQREYTDPMKKEYCNKHNIPLFEVRYDADIIKEIDSILSKYSSYVNTVPSSKEKV